MNPTYFGGSPSVCMIVTKDHICMVI